MEPELVSLVERLSGRHVRAFLSQVSVDPEIDVEIFVLTPLQASSGGD